MDELIKYIQLIYSTLLQPIDNAFKISAIEKYKKKLGMDIEEDFSKYYSKYAQGDKENGVIYTPFEIADYIVRNIIISEDIIDNPMIKICDPACGCGNLIIPCFEYMAEIYEKNLEEINKKHNLNLSIDNIKQHIVENNLFGFDIDKNSLMILKIDLFYKSGVICRKNFQVKDFLTENIDTKFDVFISNPPYVGHKSIDREYSAQLKKMYKEVFKDKGDMSYCFFQKAFFNVQKGGKLAFITSRYFFESPSGEALRKIIKGLCTIEKIIDFYGVRPFKNIGIDPVIVFLRDKQNDENSIEVLKPVYNKGSNKNLFYKSLFLKKGTDYKKFYIKQNLLSNEGWILRDKKERNIINKIEKNSFTTLSNICKSCQGIITGCDKAFVLSKTFADEGNIEKDLLKPWLKSSDISRNGIHRSDKYLIYSDLIDDEQKYAKAIKHIQLYKSRLMNRRECRKGIRKWYELQWGRKIDIFEGEKIIFPYKADKNRFALDTGSFFSADIYALILKDNVPFTYEYLLFILNSAVYEFYFKTFAKKLGEALYEYYPNNLMKLCIPTMRDIKSESELYKLFEFTDEEIEIIKSQT